MNPKSAVDLRGAQSFRREDNVLLPLSALASAVVYEAASPSRRWIARV